MLRKVLLYAVVASVTLSAATQAQLQSHWRPWNSANVPPLMQCVSKVQQAVGVPGMLLMTKNDSVAVGQRSIVPRVPLSPNDAYRIGSVTKSFTATAILILVRQGQLSLDTKMVDILGASRVSMIPNANQVTVRMLLQMTSGIAEYNTEAFRASLFENPGQHWTPDQILQSLPVTGTAPFFAPNASCAQCGEYCYQGGSCWKYANTNFVLLGMIAEQVTGRPMDALYRDLIFRPLHMTHTYMATSREFPKVRASGYATLIPEMDCPTVTIGEPGGPDFYDVTECFEPDAAFSAGAIISDADDMKTWLNELAAGTLIGPDLQTLRMQAITGVHGGFPIGYGLGLMLVQVDPNLPPIVGHAGEFFGYSSMAFFLDLDQDRVPDEYIISMVNGTGDVGDYRFPAIEMVLTKFFGAFQCPIP